MIIAFAKPMRKYNCIAYIAFHAVDRPEDRPNTLLWLTLQNFTVNIILLPYTIWTLHNNY